MGVFLWFKDSDIVEFEIEKLVHRVERAADAKVVFHLQRDVFANKRLEE
jgi:hypothetical protein